MVDTVDSKKVIDHTDRIELSDDQIQAHTNELNSLRYLAQGLHFLYAQVKKIEEKMVAQMGPGYRVFLFGNVPEFEWVPQGLVACAFHWYAVSASNYVRMVGWLANGGDMKKAGRYVQRVLPAVYVWRNKVAAHFASTDPRREDTAADLAASVMFPVGFRDDALYTSVLTLTIRQAGHTSRSRVDMGWSLTHTHQGLCQRYWPDQLRDRSDAP